MAAANSGLFKSCKKVYWRLDYKVIMKWFKRRNHFVGSIAKNKVALFHFNLNVIIIYNKFCFIKCSVMKWHSDMVTCELSVQMCPYAIFSHCIYRHTLPSCIVPHIPLYINTSSALFNTHTDSHTEWEIEILKCVCCNRGVGGLFSEVIPLGFYAMEF